MRLSPACGMISAFDTAGSLAAGAAGAASWAKPPGEANNAVNSTAPINRRRLTVNEPSDLGIEHSPVAGGPAASSQTDRDRTGRSEERSVGKECVSQCRSRWSTDHEKQQQ